MVNDAIVHSKWRDKIQGRERVVLLCETIFSSVTSTLFSKPTTVMQLSVMISDRSNWTHEKQEYWLYVSDPSNKKERSIDPLCDREA